MAVKNTTADCPPQWSQSTCLPAWSSGSLRVCPAKKAGPSAGPRKTGSKSLNEQKLASGVSGFPPEIQDGLHGFRDRQIRRIQHPGILRGSERCGRALGIARIPLAHIPQRSSRLAEIPFSINCLRRLSARATTSATRKTLRDASGNTTVPMSRRRPPGPAARGRPAGAPAAPGARRETPPRGKRSCPPLHGVSRGRRRRLPGRHAARRNAHPASRRPGPPPARPGGHALAHGGQGRQAVERAAVQHIPAQRLGDAVRHGALAGGGRPVDGDDRRGNNRICGGNGHESQNKAQAETRPAYTSK